MHNANPPTGAAPEPDDGDPIRDIIRKHWGYERLRPLQHEAMSAAVNGRDALVVMPTGGGKSLCYQAPALLADKPTVVVSPLIALMKDQVDALRTRDIPAAFLNSSLTTDDRRRVANGIHNGTYKLIFVAPERFASEAFWSLLESGGIGAFAIDEAHCISHWGHDFRGDYRRLDQLKARFPNASVHAFTATATPRVRGDVIEQLHLHDPEILVGDFFRPNLNYRAQKRGYGFADVVQAVKQRAGQPGIVYCIRRRDVDELSAWLRSEKDLSVEGYHAGMSDASRTRVQDAFAAGECDVIVATVAFGMGIDRADIRFVIHAALPQSIEHYQQETGRAGRDGEPAECILFYGGDDLMLWKYLIEKDGGDETPGKIAMLSEMYAFATGMTCRHRKLVTYFGQDWTRETCDACDICLGDLATLPDATILAQKIMSAVYRTHQRYGAAYICEVLKGSLTERVEARGHQDLSTFALMRDYPKKHIIAWIDQLTGQDLLKHEGEYRILKITPQGWQVLRNQANAKLLEPPTSKHPHQSRSHIVSDADRRGRRKEDTVRADRTATVRERSRAAPVRKRKKTTTPQPADHAPTTRVVAVLGPQLQCPTCGFSLIANTTGTCPECGEGVPFDELGFSREQFLSVAGKRAGPGFIASHRGESQQGDENDDPADNDACPFSPHEPNFQILEKLWRVQQMLTRKDDIYVGGFTHRTLRQIASKRPQTRSALMKISGVGAKKFERFGQAFLEAIQELDGTINKGPCAITASAGSPPPPRVLPEGPLNPDDKLLFEHLRELRREIADDLNVPAFVVFSDKTLRALARAKPTTEDEMLTVKGIGPSKLESFGEQFLKAITQSEPPAQAGEQSEPRP